MRVIVLMLFLYLLANSLSYGKEIDYQSELDSARIVLENVMKLSNDEFNAFSYDNIIEKLDYLVELDEDNFEARYYLAYAYSKHNSKDGSSMINMDVGLLLKTSEQLEKVIELNPKYTNELIVLDPYSKLTSEWGSLAMSYLYRNDKDSANWAFEEGKKRGAFGDYLLSINRTILNNCADSSYLICSGDNFTFPLWYLQFYKNIRNDVNCVDLGLIHTVWFTSYLSERLDIDFGMNKDELDTIEYMSWKDSTMIIEDYSWVLKPSFYEKYLLRGDIVLLNLFKKNKFEKEFYFTTNIAEESKLSLKDYFENKVMIERFTKENKEIDLEVYLSNYEDYFKLNKYVNINSVDELRVANGLRNELFTKIYELVQDEKLEEIKKVMDLIDKYYPKDKFPIESERIKTFDSIIRKALEG